MQGAYLEHDATAEGISNAQEMIPLRTSQRVFSQQQIFIATGVCLATVVGLLALSQKTLGRVSVGHSTGPSQLKITYNRLRDGNHLVQTPLKIEIID